MYGGVISTIRFFADKDSIFVAMVVPLLQPLLVAERGIVFKKGDRATASIRASDFSSFLLDGGPDSVCDQRFDPV